MSGKRIPVITAGTLGNLESASYAHLGNTPAPPTGSRGSRFQAEGLPGYGRIMRRMIVEVLRAPDLQLMRYLGIYSL